MGWGEAGYLGEVLSHDLSHEKPAMQRPAGRALGRGNSKEAGVLEGQKKKRAVSRSRANKKEREEVETVEVGIGHKTPVTECSK